MEKKMQAKYIKKKEDNTIRYVQTYAVLVKHLIAICAHVIGICAIAVLWWLCLFKRAYSLAYLHSCVCSSRCVTSYPMVNLQRDEVKKRRIGVCVRIYIHKLINTGIWLLFGKKTYAYLFKQLLSHEVFVATRASIRSMVADRLLDDPLNLKDTLWTGVVLFV